MQPFWVLELVVPVSVEHGAEDIRRDAYHVDHNGADRDCNHCPVFVIAARDPGSYGQEAAAVEQFRAMERQEGLHADPVVHDVQEPN